MTDAYFIVDFNKKILIKFETAKPIKFIKTIHIVV